MVGVMRLNVSTLALLIALVIPVVSAAQMVSTTDRDGLVRQRTERGGRADEVDALVRLVNEAAAKGLPTAPLINKVREGIAKNKDQKQIEAVVRQLTTHLDAADRVIHEIDSSSTAADREAAVTLLAETLGSGLTVDEVRELRRV